MISACDVVALFGPMPRRLGSSVLMSNIELAPLEPWASVVEVVGASSSSTGVRALPGGPNFSKNFLAMSL